MPTILIADDHPTNRKLLRAILEQAEYAVVEARDGVEALTVLERDHVDAIISDILMPNMDGYRLCLEVRKRKNYAALPFVFLTSTYTSPADERLALEHLSADRFLRRPASANEILTTLREVMAKSYNRSESAVQLPAELEVMKAYSEQLVEKLSEKNEQLAQANVDLLRVQSELEDKIAERTFELRQANRRLEDLNADLVRLANLDPLTGLLNRRAVLELGEAEWERWERYRTVFAALLLDADNFKQLNDTFGHLAGDQVLKTLAAILRTYIRKVDWVGRYGGEEFLIILPETTVGGARAAGEHLLGFVRMARVEYEQHSIQFTISVGAAEIASTDKNLDDLLKRADAALYVAKGQGRDRIIATET